MVDNVLGQLRVRIVRDSTTNLPKLEVRTESGALIDSNSAILSGLNVAGDAAQDAKNKAIYARVDLSDFDATYRALASRAVTPVSPVVTTSASATITAQLVGKQDSRFRFLGGDTTLSADSNYVINRPAKYADGSSSVASGSVGTYLGIEFMFDGSVLELRTLAVGSRFMFTVDGRLASTAATALTNNVQDAWVKVDFGSRARRRVGIYISNGHFRGLGIGALDSIWPVDTKPAPVLAVLGDSYGESFAARVVTASFDGYAHQLARLLGMASNAQNSASGTGFVKTNGLWGTYSTRVADVIASNPKIVIVPGSINDDGLSGIQAAATSVYSALKAGLPNAVIIATGTLDARRTSGQTGAAATSAGVAFIATSGWITGTGNYVSPTGNGNSDYYTYSDNSHPTTEGHLYIASRLAASIRSLVSGIPAGVGSNAPSAIPGSASRLVSGRYYCVGTATQSATSATHGVGTFRAWPWVVPHDVTLSRIGAEITSAGDVGSTVRLGIYADDGSGYPGALVLDAGTIAGDSATVQEIVVSQFLPAGLYFLGAVVQGVTTTQPTIRTNNGTMNSPLLNAAIGTSAPSAGYSVGSYALFSVAGALPVTFTGAVSSAGIGARMHVKVA
jgi:hypothetical protein